MELIPPPPYNTTTLVLHAMTSLHSTFVHLRIVITTLLQLRYVPSPCRYNHNLQSLRWRLQWILIASTKLPPMNCCLQCHHYHQYLVIITSSTTAWSHHHCNNHQNMKTTTTHPTIKKNHHVIWAAAVMICVITIVIYTATFMKMEYLNVLFRVIFTSPNLPFFVLSCNF